MSRLFKVSMFTLVLVFLLACSLISNPVNDVKNAANTAQAVASDVSSFASAMPMETLEALATTMPLGTLEALPSEIAQIGNYFDPQGTPVAEWNGIPIMPQATAGQEFDANNYSFKFTGTAKEAADFYTSNLGAAGWSPMVTTSDEQGALLVYQKDDKFLTITVTGADDGIVVWMAFTQ